MNILIICGFYLTASTLIGVIIGLFAKSNNLSANDSILAFSGGIMLYTSFSSLIIPPVYSNDIFSFYAGILGLLTGTVFISLIDGVPNFVKKILQDECDNEKIASVLLFVTAVAVHKIPEGIASGLTSASTSAQAMSLSIGLAVQNIPDGFIVSSPLVLAGVNKKKSFLVGASTALFSLFGMFLGYLGASFLFKFIDFFLAFAGGMMLFVTASLIKQICLNKLTATVLCFGIILMMLFERYI